MRPLLTIAIPTYNRCDYLKTSLLQISKQVPADGSVEIIVSDNHSTDGTKEIVTEMQDAVYPIRYVCNDENIGAERNVIQCYQLARGEYVLILGDDDLLLDNSLQQILEVLTCRKYGVVHLNGYGFYLDHMEKKPFAWVKKLLLWRLGRKDVYVFSSQDEFISSIHYYITCLSCNITRKIHETTSLEPDEFLGTSLPQLSWILAAVFATEDHAYIHKPMIASKKGNSGGYQLCRVFGTNINRIFTAFMNRGINERFFRYINKQLINNYFPFYIMIARSKADGTAYDEENYNRELKKTYKGYIGYWIYVLPIIYLPVFMARVWYAVTRSMLTAIRIIGITISGKPYRL